MSQTQERFDKLEEIAAWDDAFGWPGSAECIRAAIRHITITDAALATCQSLNETLRGTVEMLEAENRVLRDQGRKMAARIEMYIRQVDDAKERSQQP
jgi:IS5 family transposase